MEAERSIRSAVKRVNPMNNHRFVAYFTAVVAAILIGFSSVFVRVTYCDPFAIAFYRMLFALPFLGLWSFLGSTGKKVVDQKTSVLIALCGVFFALDLGIWSLSLNYTSVANSSVLNNCAVFYIPFICWILYRKQLSTSFLAAAICAILGTLLLIGKKIHFSEATVWGDSLAIISGVALAGYYILIKELRNIFSAGKIMFLTGVSTAISLAFFILLRGESFIIPTVSDAALLVSHGVIVQVCGQGLLAFSIGKISAASAGLIMLMAPVSATIAAWAFFGEAMSLFQTAGMVIVLLSIAFAKSVEEKESVAEAV